MAYDKVIDSATLDAGMAATANAIREKTGQTGAIPWENDKGFSAAVAGNQVGGGSVGESHLDYMTGLYMAFNGVAFEDGTDLVLNLGAKTNVAAANPLYACFYNAKGLKSITIICKNDPGDAITYQNFARMSQEEYTLEKIDLTGAPYFLRVSHMGRAFEYRQSLREILGEFDMTKCSSIGSIAAQCKALETISFKAGTIMKSISFIDCSKLTDETIQSIIDGLADLSGGTAQTLTLHATVGAKLTDAQKAAASAKNWTISY